MTLTWDLVRMLVEGTVGQGILDMTWARALGVLAHRHVYRQLRDGLPLSDEQEVELQREADGDA